MPYELVWTEHAPDTAAGYLADDPGGLTHLLAALDQLSDNPRPESSTPYGSTDLRRLHTGRYRTLYEITDSDTKITLIHIGRTL